LIQKILRALGKTDRKVVAVFAASAPSARALVDYLRTNLDLPIWLYTLAEPAPETAQQCTRVVIERSTPALWWRAQRELWTYQVALALTEWDGSGRHRLLKLTPFTIPFFRALVRNEEGGYFPGTPRKVVHYTKLAWQRWFRNAAIRGGEVALGSVLWVFAFIAQWCSPLSRAVFRRIRGTRHLSLIAPSTGNGVVTHRYAGRNWDAHAITELLRDSGARYIFFQPDEDRSDPADLLLLFRDPDTFVISRQHAVRSWRKLLFATAPFRRLQPDEWTRVLAPVSPAMLVDAAKLSALGVPALASYGSNWFILFYRAAAAGWHSYSAGQSATPTELPAVPYDEAEFVKTVIEDPTLRVLFTGLVVPALGRHVSARPVAGRLNQGNIAQSIHPGPGFRNRPRVLIVSPYLPFPLSHGGAVRIWNLCRALSNRVDFVLACFREQADVVQYSTLHQVFREVHVVDVDEKHHDPALPRQVNGYESSAMRELIRTLCTEQPIGILQVEYTQMARYREAAPNTPAILVEHDLTFTLYRQLSEAQRTSAAKREYEKWLIFERERLRAFDAVWTMSGLDRDRALAEGSPDGGTFAIPNGVDLARFRCPPADPASHRVLYVGSFRHLPNYLAFEELRTRIMPEVWKTLPDATLDVVAGPQHLEHWRGAREVDRRIAVHGFIENLVPLYAAATVVVVPLPVSAGTNIKLMEALSCQRAVVSTPVGCAGLDLQDSRDLLIRDLGPGFARAVSDLLTDAAMRATIANNGLQQARERFSWNAIADDAYRSYCAVNPSWQQQPSHSELPRQPQPA